MAARPLRIVTHDTGRAAGGAREVRTFATGRLDTAAGRGGRSTGRRGRSGGGVGVGVGSELARIRTSDLLTEPGKKERIHSPMGGRLPPLKSGVSPLGTLRPLETSRALDQARRPLPGSPTGL